MSASLALFDDLYAVVRLYRTRLRAALARTHPALIGSQARVLLYIGSHPGVSQRDLIEYSRADKAQMGRLLLALEQSGWVVRTPSAHDKRLRVLMLSDTGTTLVAALTAVQQQVADALLRELSPAPQQQLQAALKTILATQAD